ncbi:MAG: diaminopimelate decarboxylase [Archaeoglobus sp.]|nr:MAG: diaminopimelate decarboxylase [Archaeoglobus sp.]
MRLILEKPFNVKQGKLYIEKVSCVELVENYGSPLYVTSLQALNSNINSYLNAFSKTNFDVKFLYAVKANNNLTIMRLIAKKGFGADVFSDGELYMALLAGFDRNYILFNGNSKSDEEIRMGVEAGVSFSVDSIDELNAIIRVAKELDRVVRIAFRVNPDISPETHPKIATGLKTSKFGIPWKDIKKAYEYAIKNKNLLVSGIHCHIGSQITDISPFVEAIKRMFDVAKEIEKLGVDIEFIDIGGGLGIDYEGKGAPTPSEFAEKIVPAFEMGLSSINSQPELWIEPGRSIVGNTTVLLTRVNAVKKAYKNFVAVDAGFNLLVRPAMYNAYHKVTVANKMDERESEIYTIVGPICESGDILAEDRKLPVVERGDIIAIFDVGAYGFSMSSQYNGRRRCAEVLVDNDRTYVIRERESYSDLVANQLLPVEFI